MKSILKRIATFINRIIGLFDERDIFVFIGFVLLFLGIKEQFGSDTAMIVVGSIILLKGLTKWV